MLSAFKKMIRLSLTAFFLAVSISPVAFAQSTYECDLDGDGYISLGVSGADLVLGESFEPNGDYSPAEWANFFSQFKNDVAAGTLCADLNFRKGAEPVRCDQTVVSSGSGVFDASRVQNVAGTQVYPGAFDTPDNGIDEDCDGADGELSLTTRSGADKNLGQVADRSLVMLSRLVVLVSIVFLLWGAILYSSAGGDEHKTGRAKKAMIGAVIGLIVGLLAPTIVNSIVSLL